MFRISTKPLDISKELENINFKHAQREEVPLETFEIRESRINKSHSLEIKVEPKTQFVVFQSTTKLLFAIGKCIGLSPMTGTWDTNSNMRLGVFLRKFLFAIVIGVIQVIGVILSVIYLKVSFSTRTVGKCIFYLSTASNTFLSIYTAATKLPKLLRELSKLQVEDDFDPTLKIKSYATCFIILTTTLLEHILFYFARLAESADKSTIDNFDNNAYTQKTNSQYCNLGYIGERALGVIIQILNFLCGLNWNYSDMYIMCISIYLTSLLKHINKKIVLASDKHYLPPSYWRALREEYNRVTRLVHSFDDIISGFVFISFANTMFYLCVQFYSIILGIKIQRDQIENNVSGDLYSINIKESSLFLGFSAAYLLARTLSVCLLAAAVHSASLVPATALYNVPASSFSREVARFLNQVHADKVAISGLRFFYVTREFILSMVGTLITYELVLLQFGEEGL